VPFKGVGRVRFRSACGRFIVVPGVLEKQRLSGGTKNSPLIGRTTIIKINTRVTNRKSHEKMFEQVYLDYAGIIS
jgi:hypothetical protein